MKFVPLNDWILVRPDKPPTHAGKIVLPTNMEVSASSYSGIVVDIAGSITLIAIGERLFFSKHCASEINIDGERLLLVKQENVYGTVQ